MVPGTAFKEKDGTRGWELGHKRRVTVGTFRGKKYVGIREYYEDKGKVTAIVGIWLMVVVTWKAWTQLES